jgi:hypothetical protein
MAALTRLVFHAFVCLGVEKLPVIIRKENADALSG